MKITLTTGIFPPDIGGPASFIPMFADKLLEKGIDVEIITLSDTEEDYSKYPYKVIAINRKIKKPFRDYFVIKEIIKSAKTSDLIFSNTLAFESAVASIIVKKPLIQKVVGDIAWERANSSNRFKGSLDDYQSSNNLCLKSKLTNIYRNFGVNHSDLIITPSKYLCNIVKKWTNKDVKVIYNAVEFVYIKQIIPKEKFRIISVARLIPHKGIDGIIRTLSKLNFEFEYIVLGDGNLKKELENLARSLNIDAKFLGNVSKKEVAKYLKSSDLFILNSSYEGLPHVILEAMYYECPIIASNVGGTPEIVKDGENGFLFEYNNQKELLKKIYLLKDENIKEKIIKNAKQFVKQFADVDKMVEEYIKIFERFV